MAPALIFDVVLASGSVMVWVHFLQLQNEVNWSKFANGTFKMDTYMCSFG
jgi:hypothetical protein